jgi:hypothetical protein
MRFVIYAIDAFPDDAQLWRIDWIGGVAYDARRNVFLRKVR